MKQQRLQVTSIEIASKTRADRWHNGNMKEWSVLEWAGAMCGEAGECANWAKKLKRLESQMESKNEVGRWANTAEELKIKIAKEAADTILYAMCIFNALDIDAEDTIREVFNTKSDEYGFPEHI